MTVSSRYLYADKFIVDMRFGTVIRQLKMDGHRAKNTKLKNYALAFIIVSCAIVYTVYRSCNSTISVKVPLVFRNNTKFVLFWTKMFDSETFYFESVGYELFQKCEYKNCYATRDRHLLNMEDYDALMFHIPTWYSLYEVIPKRRYAHQRYIFVDLESPVYYPEHRAQYLYNNFYNWTMTYRLDSDIPGWYGRIDKVETNYTMPSVEFVKNKTRSIAWFVSNCNAFNKRDELANKLSKYIDVDIYGKCGTLTCPRSEKCYEMVEKKYRFYLSFENSNCRDYITEKFYNIMKLDVIPIVYGGGNYSAVAPSRSHINVQDYPDVESLAKYLKSLEDNVDEYLKYFEWKRHYRITDENPVVCKLCEMLSNPNQEQKTYEDVIDWWYSTNNSLCKTGEQLPNIVLD